MRKTLTSVALAALTALPMLIGPTDAAASCQSRKNTGTALGAVGGALVGNSISKGAGGLIVGGLGGAVIGHEIARGGCAPARHADYRRARYASEGPPPAQRVYYDQRGNPVSVAPSGDPDRR
jgi:uncharacterized membrane protein